MLRRQTNRLSSSRPKNTMPTATASSIGPRLERQPGDVVLGAQAQHEREQGEGDETGEEGIREGPI